MADADESVAEKCGVVSGGRLLLEVNNSLTFSWFQIYSNNIWFLTNFWR